VIDSAKPRSNGHAQRARSGGVLAITGHLRAGYWLGANYGPIFRRLRTKVHQIMSADAGEIVACNAVFRLSISCSVPEIFAIEVRSRLKSRQKSMFFGLKCFWGKNPKFWTYFLKLHPFSITWQSFAAIDRDRGDIALKKKKKQQQNIRAAVALSQSLTYSITHPRTKNSSRYLHRFHG